jgi:hypothetical protein
MSGSEQLPQQYTLRYLIAFQGSQHTCRKCPGATCARKAPRRHERDERKRLRSLPPAPRAASLPLHSIALRPLAAEKRGPWRGVSALIGGVDRSAPMGRSITREPVVQGTMASDHCRHSRLHVSSTLAIKGGRTWRFAA